MTTVLDLASSSPPPDDFNPGWRFYASFTSLCIITLAVALDATTLSVALPVIRLPFPFSQITSYKIFIFLYFSCTPGEGLQDRQTKCLKPGHIRIPPRQRHRSLLERDLLLPILHRLPTNLRLPILHPRPQISPPRRPCLLHRRCTSRCAQPEFHDPLDRPHHPGSRRRRHHVPDRNPHHGPRPFARAR